MPINLDSIFEKIDRAASKTGRSLSDITLVAATKTVDIQRIRNVVKSGVKDIGENRVQELLQKYDKDLEVNWHFIGHLQTNKVKYIVDKVCLIHSVDSLSLAEEINRRAEKIGKIQEVLIQINLLSEVAKSGVLPEKSHQLITEVSKLPSVKIMGLMFMPPVCHDAKLVKRNFMSFYDFFIDISEKKYDNVIMSYLSMGMSDDYELAIESGATHIRIGRAVFGER